VSQAAGDLVSPVTGGVAGVVGSVSQAAVSPVTGAAAGVVSHVAASAKPVLAPVSGAVGAVVSPVTGALAPVSQVVRSLEPILAGVTRPVAGLVAPLTRAVGGLVRPVLGAAAPRLPDLLAPVAADLPVVAPVTGVVGPAGRHPDTVPGKLIELIHPAYPLTPSVGGAETPVPSGKSAARPADVALPMASEPDCRGTAGPGLRREPASAHPAVSVAGVPGHAPPAPAPPGAPAPSDVTCGAGSPIPPAFLAFDHGPREFRVSTLAHGVFVPLWRPCEPGTGPG
jgi:hypothetical protein